MSDTNEAVTAASTAEIPMAQPVAEPAADESHVARVRRPRTRRPAAESETIGSAVQEIVQQAQENGEKRKPLPDPHGFESIDLTGDNKGPKMHLARNHRYQRMEMKFDQNPGEEVLTALKDQGWSWRGQDKAWLLPLDREARYAEHLAAEKLLRDIGNTIREQNGLGPVCQLAVV